MKKIPIAQCVCLNMQVWTSISTCLLHHILFCFVYYTIFACLFLLQKKILFLSFFEVPHLLYRVSIFIFFCNERVVTPNTERIITSTNSWKPGNWKRPPMSIISDISTLIVKQQLLIINPPPGTACDLLAKWPEWEQLHYHTQCTDTCTFGRVECVFYKNDLN